MNTKFSKILSVLAVVAITASSFAWIVPVAAAPGESTWFKETIPSGSATSTSNVLKNGAQIVDFAVADASTIYAIDFAGSGVGTIPVPAAGSPIGRIYKSTNGGQGFTNISGNMDATVANTAAVNSYGGLAPTKIAVAKDNISALAVTDGVDIFISQDAGASWSKIAGPGGTIMDIDISPARSGTLYGREYAIAVSNPAAAGLGSIYLIGADPAWTAPAAGILGSHDYVAVSFTPNYLGDLCVTAVGALAAGVDFQIINRQSPGTIIQTTTFIPAIAGITEMGIGAATDIKSADIALPINFDPSASAGSARRAYVGISSGVIGVDDVFRIEGPTTFKDLGVDQSISSVSYSGTTSAGKCFAGLTTAAVKYVTDPFSSTITWNDPDTNPSGATNAIVDVAADFATTNRVFASTSGINSAFSISNDGALNFTGEAFINMGADNVNAIEGFEVIPSGATAYMLTRSSTLAPPVQLSLWKCNTPVSGTGWSRIWSQAMTAGATGTKLVLNPDFATTPALFVVELGASAGKVYVSTNSGMTFSNRNLPGAVRAFAVQDSQVVYAAVGINVWKSINGAFGWGSVGVSSGVGTAIDDMIVPKADVILCSGTASFAYSTNGGTTFTTKNTGLPGGATFKIVADGDYATTPWVYAGSSTGSVYRYSVGAANWDAINSIAGAISDVAFKNSTLYAMRAAACDRIIDPKSIQTPNNGDWSTLSTGDITAAGATINNVSIAAMTDANILYATDIQGADNATASNVKPALYAYRDWEAVTAPEVIEPADNFSVGLTAAGTSLPIFFNIKKAGTGSGVVTQIEIEYSLKTVGFPGIMLGPIAVAGDSYKTSQLTGLLPNTEYLWRVRFADTISNDAVFSKWTTPRTLTVKAGVPVQQQYQGPILTSLQGAAAVNVNPALVGFSWAPLGDSTEYQVIVSTDSALTKTVGGTPAKTTTTSFQVTGLEFGTTYFWAVKATKPTESIQNIGTFTTMAKPVVAPTGPAGTSQPPITVVVPPTSAETPAYIWAVIAIGAILVIAVIILIVRTRRVP